MKRFYGQCDKCGTYNDHRTRDCRAGGDFYARRYREIKSGEYLEVYHGKFQRAYYTRIGRPHLREARACCLAGDPASICTTSISLEWLHRKCRRVSSVPRKWQRWL